MTEATVPEEAPVKKGSKIPLLIGLVLALAGGGGGFFAAQEGLLPIGGASHEDAEPDSQDEVSPLPNVAFLELPQLTVSMSPGSQSRHLIFRASLEVPSAHAPDVETLTPRIIDVLNGYLRALKSSDLEAPGALIKLRAQMLRRVQIVVGEGRVNDLLVMEFVLN